MEIDFIGMRLSFYMIFKLVLKEIFSEGFML